MKKIGISVEDEHYEFVKKYGHSFSALLRIKIIELMREKGVNNVK